ncbi:aldose 1-epimerase family protein [Brenneria populi subsp. brevivirga]|uniref:aldose 1-epimerase family protein n=1 Tax=Brenneria populi TaxID=1505588 RepID=UPI002E18164A|nr:aldose 1-epimerase family protein [Brenneria populi subsp. brevivirga]
MSTQIHLSRSMFTELPRILLENERFSATAFRYASGIEAIKLQNARGYAIVLPFYGQMIWDAEFDGHSLTMSNPFTEPKPGSTIIDTYGCFAFHSGLLSNGCPAEDDCHPLHGEMACAPMDDARLVLGDNTLALTGSYEYVKGFGHHYRAAPAVTIAADSALLGIDMTVTNLASAPMPLQYMCHMNYAYVAGATFSQNIPERAFALRSSIPGHVHPTPQWLSYTERLARAPESFNALDEPEFYDPEIVFFADNLSQYARQAEFSMHAPQGHRFVTRFSTAQLNYATRWILYNGDQKVAAFALPATCRPEGHQAARRAGTLIEMAAGETRYFHVETGLA